MPDLSTRTARRRLTPRHDEYWSRIARGRALGYRRSEGSRAGTWYVRAYSGGQYRKEAFASADDLVPADGDGVLTYAQAIERARDWSTGAKRDTELTVSQAVAHYLDWYKVHRRAWKQVRYSMNAHVLPELGDVRLADLTVDRLRQWHEDLARSPVKLRSGRVQPLKTDEDRRARKVTANRVLAQLKAALNRAVEDGKAVPGDWQRVRSFRGVEVARTRVLDSQELRRLLNGSESDFRDLVAGAIYTGARYSELAALRVSDYRPEAGECGAVHFRKTKGGDARYVYLSDEGRDLFEQVTAGRGDRERIFMRADGQIWGKNHQQRRIKATCVVAHIEPPLRFHELRHSYASLYLMSGGSLVGLAKQLGHTSTRMVERHYGHLADTWRSAEAREHAPKLGLEKGKVERMRAKGAGNG